MLTVSAFASPEFTAGVLSAAGGRYVMGSITGVAAMTYVLDTQTGRVWQLVQGKTGESVLAPVNYMTLAGNRAVQPVEAAAEVADYGARGGNVERKKAPSAESFLDGTAPKATPNPSR